jgi:SNF2 family DNA or RNA helicase
LPDDVNPPTNLKGTLMEYQVKWFKLLISLYGARMNVILGDEMWLGKTAQAIAMLAWLFEKRFR